MEMNDTGTAAAIVARLEASNLKPDVFLCTVLVKVYCKLGDVKKVSNIWAHIRVLINMNICPICSNSK